jgi:hypothetical protein
MQQTGKLEAGQRPLKPGRRFSSQRFFSALLFPQAVDRLPPLFFDETRNRKDISWTA